MTSYFVPPVTSPDPVGSVIPLGNFLLVKPAYFLGPVVSSDRTPAFFVEIVEDSLVRYSFDSRIRVGSKVAVCAKNVIWIANDMGLIHADHILALVESAQKEIGEKK